ncbi:MAG TPA: protein-L-isoaspartate(D-aspartate) O-methyltransferase [Gammaproteobacteria bacterium]|nr:protein-L-isoaspartate(D-aspartate) O-methyltransferase [Gammaproteobacteria bacterium]HDZ78191.1 protein-L-isoaspartate(D-aspartate) O-methyltransferase [Gammaproteobacteria bacterium]
MNLKGIGMTSMRTRARLISSLRDMGITDERVLAAMMDTPRHLFVDEGIASHAYDNSSLPIGYGQTISQPYIVALMTQVMLGGGKPAKVLEIGTGSGYQTTILSKLAGTVYSVERIEPLLKQAKRLHYKLRLRNIYHKLAKGKTFGWPDAGPFDGILVTAAPQTIPEELYSQLAPGGRMVIPSGKDNAQELYLIERTNSGFTKTSLEAVRFVPLVEGS